MPPTGVAFDGVVRDGDATENSKPPSGTTLHSNLTAAGEAAL